MLGKDRYGYVTREGKGYVATLINPHYGDQGPHSGD